MEPNRLVCPTVATAFAGTTTSGLTEISTSACHWGLASTVILPTLPTTTSLISTGEFDSRVATFATSTWYLAASGPRPTAPGSGSEFRPWKAQPVNVIAAHDPTIVNRFTPANHDGGVPSAGSSGALESAGGGAVCGRSMLSTLVDPAGMFDTMLGGPGIGAPGNSAGDGVAGASLGLYRPCGGGRFTSRGAAAHRPCRCRPTPSAVARARRPALRPRGQLRVGVDQPVRIDGRPQVEVDREREVVDVEQPQRGTEVLRAQFRRFGCCGVLDRADQAAEEKDRVGEVCERECSGDRAAVRVVDVVHSWRSHSA